ncbi:hypothetical protein JEQ12_004744 [Ovis aries]|uniref:Uncharacterized protein n=1 Tax=Ovis aries TaxID=9940 RepID=A0A836A4J5_SHEEP|nr:hypothetical protein JEQ12_004744 [Ovis aries]
MFQEGALRLKEATGLPLQDSHPPGLALPTRFPDFTTGAGAESCTPHVLLALGVLGQDGCQSQMPMTAALLHIWKGNRMEAESDQTWKTTRRPLRELGRKEVQVLGSVSVAPPPQWEQALLFRDVWCFDSGDFGKQCKGRVFSLGVTDILNQNSSLKYCNEESSLQNCLLLQFFRHIAGKIITVTATISGVLT